MSRGRFITFEGGEACGKSTQIQLLAERLRAAGRCVRLLREPGGTPLGEKIRHLLKHDSDGRGMAAETELLLLNASRAELVRRVIRPALDAGEFVLCDRFHDSTVAYQGSGRGLGAAMVRAVVAAAIGTTQPDLTLWLRVSPEEARQRLLARTATTPTVADRFEEEPAAFFQRVEAGYAAIATAEPERFRVVDGSGSADVVAGRIWTLIQPLLAGEKL